MNAHVLMLPHLKKFALFQEGLPQEGVIDLTSGNMIPLLLNPLLVGKSKSEKRKTPLSKKYSARLPIMINSRKINSTRRCFINDDNTRMFNRQVRCLMDNYLRMKIAANVPLGICEADTIRWFIDTLDLHDDISFWAFSKMMQRWRNRQNPNKIPAFGDHFVLSSKAV